MQRVPLRSTSRPLLAVALAALLLAPASIAQDPPKHPPAAQAVPAVRAPEQIVIAYVEGRPLTLKEAIDTFLSSHTGHGVLVRGEPAVRELAGRLVERELFLLEAETLGLGEDERVLEVVKSFGDELAGDEYWKREVKDKAIVSDEEVESFYAKTDVALRLTLIATADKASAEALRARVAAGEDMAALARTQSIHESRTFDGTLSYVRRGEIDRNLEDPAFALETPGELSPVVAIELGFAFVRLDERSINPERPPRDTAIPQIRGILEERLTKKLAKEVEERTQREAEVWIDEAKLTRELVLDGPDATVLVARAAGDTLTLQDIRDALELDAVRAAPVENTADIGLKVARHWTRAEAIKLAARRAGLMQDPAIQQKIASFKRDVLMKILCDRYVWPDVQPKEEEVRAYYETNRDTEFTVPAEVRLAYIVLSTSEEAYSVLDRIAAGDTFEQLARERSKDSASSVHGGRIGWVKPGELLPVVEERAFALKAGAVDGPIETDVGFFVVKAIERKEARPVSYAVARASAEKALLKQRQNEAYSKWAKALRERAEVSLDEPGVTEAVAWLENEALKREAEKAARPKPSGNAPPGHGPAPVIEGVKAKPSDKPAEDKP